MSYLKNFWGHVVAANKVSTSFTLKSKEQSQDSKLDFNLPTKEKTC